MTRKLRRSWGRWDAGSWVLDIRHSLPETAAYLDPPY